MNGLRDENLFETIHRFVMASANDEPTMAPDIDLARLLEESEEAREIYLECVHMSLLLPSILAAEPEDEPPIGGAPMPGVVCYGVATVKGSFFEGMPFAYSVATVILGMGIFIASLIHGPTVGPDIERSPGATAMRLDRSSVVGQITGLVDCKWAEDPRLKVQGSRLSQSRNPQIPKALVSLGDQFHLTSGLMEITYDSGAKVILQGPATYEVDTVAGGYLSVGRLTARVEKNKTNKVASGQWPVADESRNPSRPTTHYPLFTIKTPTAIVTDLGTEFGVDVKKNGETTSHVFRGSVKVQRLGDQGEPKGDERVLRANESVRVERRGDQSELVTLHTFSSTHFVRELSKPDARHDIDVKTIDLADIVAGGDGFSGKRDVYLDPSSGQLRKSPYSARTPSDYIQGDGGYHLAESLPFVDGVFVPDGRNGPVQTDSAGHRFDGFDATSNVVPGYIWVAGAEPFDCPRTKLGDIEYGSPEHAMLYVPSNSGITFDLDTIRRAHPGWAVSQFRCVAGNTENQSERGGQVNATIVVLVDGRQRFKRREINSYNGAFPITVPLGESDRYLTLVSADGNNQVLSDWIVFGDPRLEMVIEPFGERRDMGGK